MKPTHLKILYHLLRLGLAAVFVCAGIVKLGDISRFSLSVGEFGLVPDALVRLTTWVIGLLEILVGIGLAVNLRGSLTVVLLLLTLFVGVLVYGIVLGLDIECGCFGPGYHLSLKTQVAIDFGLLTWCGLVYWSRRKCGARTIRLVALLVKSRGQESPPA
jgi:uncharacterized membrane protein YphA (DoxX/SURF4 family)